MEKPTYLQQILQFLKEIEIPVVETTLPNDTFLPGLDLGANCILVDYEQLKYPGDLLHEAGHLAVTTPEQRHAIGTDQLQQPFPNDGEEIVALLWSYAAALHIGLPLEVLFHPDGYKGQSDWLIETFESGTHIGLPLLEWMGLTLSPALALSEGKEAFPVMQNWVRVATSRHELN